MKNTIITIVIIVIIVVFAWAIFFSNKENQVFAPTIENSQDEEVSTINLNESVASSTIINVNVSTTLGE